MVDKKHSIGEKMLGIGTPYCVEYMKFKENNPSYCNSNVYGTYSYYSSLLLSRLLKKGVSKASLPNDSSKYPYIESKNTNRPGDKNFLKKLLEYDVISFDIFDTAVYRNVYSPRDVFKIIGIEMGFDNFKSIRMEAERIARVESYSIGGTSEVELEDIYRVLHNRFNIDYRWMDREIELELYLTVSNLYIKRLYDKLLDNGKIVIFTSDMYLPKSVIEKILEKNGYVGYDKLFLSGDLKKSKKDGSIYDFIKSQYGHDKKYYHIGDNYPYDIKNAQANGFDTYYYRSVRELSKPYVSKEYSDISYSVYRAIISNLLHNGTWRNNIYYEHGFKVGGILVAGYCEFINSIVRRKQIDKILFCARDCDIIYKIYNKYYKNVDNEYVYLSRYSLMQACPERYYYDLLNRTISKLVSCGGSVRELLKNMDADYLEDCLLSAGIKKDLVITKTNDNLIKNIIMDNICDVIIHNKELQNNAIKYFCGNIKDKKRILIVDIGWSGSCLSMMKYLINEYISADISVYGSLLMGNINDQLSVSTSDGFIETYVTGPSNNMDISSIQYHIDSKLLDKNNQMFEYIFTSVEGSTIGYRDDNGVIKPVLSDKSRVNVDEILDMQNGMIDFVEKYEKYTKKFRRLFSISPYVAYLPFSEIIDNNDYCEAIYSNFAYDAAVYQSKDDSAITFGKKFRTCENKINILLISHSFSHTGAPHSLLRIGKVLLDLGYYCEVWSPHAGGMGSVFESYGISTCIIGENMLHTKDVINRIKKFNFCIVNTILTYEYYLQVSRYIPTIWYVREASNIPDYCTKKYNWKMYNTLCHAKKIYCVSEYAQYHLSSYNKNVSIVKNCVEDRFLDVTTNVTRESNLCSFLVLGSVEPRKGYHILIDAMNILNDEGCQYEVIFAGQIPKQHAEYGINIIKNCQHFHNLHYLGEIKNDYEVSLIESKCDVILVPSLDESCSLVALEATMHSKPLIVTENVGAKYMVEGNGFVVKTGSSKELANAMKWMIDNPEMLKSMGLKSRMMYESYASMDRHIKDLQEMILKETCSKVGIGNHLRNNIVVDLNKNIYNYLIAVLNGKIYESSMFFRKVLFSSKYADALMMYYNQFLDYKCVNSVVKRETDNIIISLTSYPARIGTVHICIQSLLNQSLRADKVILYLAYDQFPLKEKSLPSSLTNLMKNGLSIEWCDDLKSHKKYYYAIKNNPESIVITVDDDIIYDKYMVSRLYLSYIKYPECVSCLRAHRIKVNEMGCIDQYINWKWEDNSFFGHPSFQAIATGCSGVLYPPKSLNEAVFDKKSIVNDFLYVDDIWLKMMEILNSTPVVLADVNKKLTMIDGTQEVAISNTNVLRGNDIAIRTMIEKYDADGIIVDMISNDGKRL